MALERPPISRFSSTLGTATSTTSSHRRPLGSPMLFRRYPTAASITRIGTLRISGMIT